MLAREVFRRRDRHDRASERDSQRDGKLQATQRCKGTHLNFTLVLVSMPKLLSTFSPAASTTALSLTSASWKCSAFRRSCALICASWSESSVCSACEFCRNLGATVVLVDEVGSEGAAGERSVGMVVVRSGWVVESLVRGPEGEVGLEAGTGEMMLGIS